MNEKVKVGAVAPDFTLVDAEMKPRSLGEFRSRNVVIAFYPGAFTSACTKEMCRTFLGVGEAENVKSWLSCNPKR